MKRLLLIVLVMALMMLGLMPAGAQAAKPLDVDCDVLKSAIGLAADEVPDEFELKVSDLLKDSNLFDQFNALIGAFSGGAISFDSASQGLTTTAKCRLVPYVIEVLG